MAATKLKSLLDIVLSWPEEDQEALLDAARDIQARRTGAYVMTPDERAAVMEGLDEARRGEFVPDVEMDALWKRTGA